MKSFFLNAMRTGHKKLSVLLFLLTLIVGAGVTLRADTFFLCPNDGSIPTGTNVLSYNYILTGHFYHNSANWMIYTADELGNNTGIITSIAFYCYQWSSTTTNSDQRNMALLVRNTDASTVTTACPITGLQWGQNPTSLAEAQGWHVAKVWVQPALQIPAVNTWWPIDFEDNPFSYEGGNLEVMFVDFQNSYTTSWYPYFWRYNDPDGAIRSSGNRTDNTPPTLVTGMTFNHKFALKIEMEMGENKMVSFTPGASELLYAGVPWTASQLPSVTFYKEKESGANGRFTYRITRLSDGKVVYRAKSGTGGADTFINTVGWGSDIKVNITRADSSMGMPDGSVRMADPLPQSGVYQVRVAWYGGSGNTAKEIQTRNITINEALPEYHGVTPNMGTPIVAGLNLMPPQYPSISSRRVAAPVKPPIITYTIKGPNNNIVYQAKDEETGSYNVTLNTDTIGVKSRRIFRSASGSAAVTSGPNAGLLNTTVMPRGLYHIYVTFNDQIGPIQEFVDSFRVTLEYDLAMDKIIVPKTYTEAEYNAVAQQVAALKAIATTKQDSAAADQIMDNFMATYTVLKGMNVPIEYQISNNGVHSLTAFDFNVEIYRAGGIKVVDTILHYVNTITPIQPVATTQIKSSYAINTTALGAGTYYIRGSVESVNPASDFDMTNNAWGEGTQHLFTIREPFVINDITMTEPTGTAYRYPYYPTFDFASTGLYVPFGAPVTLSITKRGATTPEYYREKLMDAVSGFKFTDPFIPLETGTYDATLTVDIVGTIKTKTWEVKVLGGYGEPGKTTVYPVSAANFSKTMKDLYYKGVQGHVVFELTSKKYTFTEDMVDDDGTPIAYPDFRSKIMGVGPDATITFRPSNALLGASEPIIFDIGRNDGLGLAFGQSIKPENPMAAVNKVIEIENKRYFANTNGYITFDGGSRKNIEIQVTGAKYIGNRSFTAPVFLGSGANHITITNCRLIGSGVAPYAKSTDLPIITFENSNNEPKVRYTSNLYTNFVGTPYAFSGGVVIRATQTPADELKLYNNINNQTIQYVMDIQSTDNNLIQGNFIKGFGYGIISLGLGAYIENDINIIPSYNVNNQFIDNLIQSPSKAGIFLGFEKDAVIKSNKITNINCTNPDIHLASGIQIGQPIRDNNMMDGQDLSYNNINVKLEANDVGKINNTDAAAGIFVYQPNFTLTLMSANTNFPSTPLNVTITNNVVYDINAANFDAPRFGIAVFAGERGNNIFNTNGNNFNNVKIASNTIVMKLLSIVPPVTGATNWSEIGSAGIAVQYLRKYNIINNAISNASQANDDHFDYNTGIMLRTQNPANLSDVKIDFNAYDIQGKTDNTSLVRFFELDNLDRILYGGGYAAEYATLRNWRSWAKSDKNSISYGFTNDMGEALSNFFPGTSGRYYKLRMRSWTIPLSPMDRGTYVEGITSDVDNVARARTNIGAIEFYVTHLDSDLEVGMITAPNSYRNLESKFKEEYVMLRKNEKQLVKVMVRNAGESFIPNATVNCRVQPQVIDNATGNLVPALTDSKVISLAVGEEKEVTFFDGLSNPFAPKPYAEYTGVTRATIDNFGYLPEFDSMRQNVTPAHTIQVYSDYEDNNINNNNTDIQNTTVITRFFVPKAKLNLLVSAENIIASLYRMDVDHVTYDTTYAVDTIYHYDTTFVMDTTYEYVTTFDTTGFTVDTIGKGSSHPTYDTTWIYTTIVDSNIVSVQPSNVVDTIIATIDSIFTTDNIDFIKSDTTWIRVDTCMDKGVAAGRLNYDTVISALAQINYPRKDLDDGKYNYDVLDRNAWNPRSVNYTGYKAVIWSDGLDNPLTHEQKKDLINFADVGVPSRKTTFIVASQEILRMNSDATDELNKSIMDNILRANTPIDVHDFVGNVKGKAYNLNQLLAVGSTNYPNDPLPTPSTFTMKDTVYGNNFVTYYIYNGPDTKIEENIVGMLSKMMNRNLVYTSIDWRHLKYAGQFLAAIFADLGPDFTSGDDNDDAVMPIILVDFNANAIGHKVALDWTTAAENNLANFAIERADVYNNFTGLFSKIGVQQPNNFMNSSTDYNYVDNEVRPGGEYAYRLRLNNFDGSYMYSNIRNAKIEVANGITIGNVAPNPTYDGFASIEYTTDRNVAISISLTDMAGREVASLFSGNVMPGTHKVNINASQLAAGTYNVVFFIDGQLIQKSITLTISK